MCILCSVASSHVQKLSMMSTRSGMSLFSVVSKAFVCLFLVFVFGLFVCLFVFCLFVFYRCGSRQFQCKNV